VAVLDDYGKTFSRENAPTTRREPPGLVGADAVVYPL
jgi:hypothetical protein